MATPPPPANPPQPPNPGQGQLFGTNNLGHQIDALTRAFTTFTNRFASTAGLSTMGWQASNAGQAARTGEQLGRLQTRYQQTTDAHQVARQRMQDELDRQQITWDRQLRAGTARINNGRLTAAQRQEAQDRLDENAILFASSQARTRREWQLTDDQHSSALTQMAADMQRLQRTQRMQTTMNRISMGAQVGGAVVGLANSYFSGGFEDMLGQYSRRMGMIHAQFNGESPGKQAQGFGYEMKRYGSIMWANNLADAFGGQTALVEQNPLEQLAVQSRRATAAAYLTPGLGITGAAQMQQELGTGQAYYASQMFGLAPTRFAGGAQNSPAAMALSLAQRVNAGNFGRLTHAQLAAEFAQGGTLSMSLANYAQAAGLSGQTVEAMRNQTEVLRYLMNPDKKSGLKGMSEAQALKILNSAGGRDKQGDQARSTIEKATGGQVGGSYQDAQRYLQGLDREGHLPASASFLDAAKASANSLADIHALLQKTLGPIASFIGDVSGTFKGGGVAGGLWSRIKGVGSGFKKGWNMGPNVFFGDWGAGTDQSSWAKSAWHGLQGLFGGDSGTPVSKQTDNKVTSGKSGIVPGGIMKALSFAGSHVGDKYVLGANGPRAWDCSSLVQHAYAAAGVKLPRTTYEQIHKGVEVPMDKLQPGDLVFYKDISHVGMYAGGGKVIEAANPTKGVVEGPMYSKFVRARRVMSGGVAATGTLSGNQTDPTTNSGSTDSGGIGISAAGDYGSVEEVDALAAALTGGSAAGRAQTGSKTPQATQNSEAATGNTDTGGTSDAGKNAPKNVAGSVAIGKKMAADKYGWSGAQWTALYNLWLGESNWRWWAENSSSGAYGIPQSLPASKLASAGSDWKTNPATQIAWGLKYIKSVYGNPATAWAKWQARNPHWYDKGAWEVPGQPGQGLDVKLHGGEMVLDRNQAHTVRQALLNQGLTPNPGQGSNSRTTQAPAVNLHFNAGSVVVQMPTASAEGARSAAEAFVTHIAADDRIKSLMGGW